MKLRRFISLCMIGALVNIVPCVAYAAEEMSTTFGNLGTATSTVILAVDYGAESSRVQYHEGVDEEYEAGPEAFYVENENSIYILDTLNKRINHYVNGQCTDEILLGATVAPQSFRIDVDGTIYVCDTYNGESTLRVYYTNGTEKTILLEDLYYINIRNIEIVSENIVALSDWYDVYLYEISGEEACLLKKTALACTEETDVTYSKYIGGNANCHYEMQTTIVDSGMLFGEISVVVYNAVGQKIGSARVPLEDFVFRPNQYVQIGVGGTVYFMIPGASGLQIRKVTLGAISDSKLDEVEARAAQYDLEVSQEALVASAFVTLTRQEVLTRANTIVNQTWTLSAENVNGAGFGTELEIPIYIREIATSGALGNGGTVSMTGIPYCWGGFDSCYTSYTPYSTFVEAIENGYIAGNVSTSSGSQVDGTAGLDCSGFASAAYGISRLTTKGFDEKGTVVTKDTINTMDYLVRRNYYDELGERKSNHVILFYNWQSTDKSRMLIIETALSTEKTVVRVVDTDDYVECGFEMKTPW